MGFIKSASQCVFFKPKLQFCCLSRSSSGHLHSQAGGQLLDKQFFSLKDSRRCTWLLAHPPPPTSLSLTGDTHERMRKRGNLLTGEWGRGGGRGAESNVSKKAWSSKKTSNILCWFICLDYAVKKLNFSIIEKFKFSNHPRSLPWF